MWDLRQLTDSHSYAVREERREVGNVGKGEVSAGTPDGPDSSIVIKQPLMEIRQSTARSRRGLWLDTHIFVILEDVETSHLGGGLL